MAEICLATLNAKFIHPAFGLRYLLANLGPLRPAARLLEFDLRQRPADIAELLLAENPSLVGLGVYIWNVGPTTELVALLKRLRPELPIILGGPEVSHEPDQQAIVALADTVIAGEADLKFAEVCRAWLAGRRPASKLIAAEPPAFQQLTLPYDLYTEADIAHRVLYVEASRGCPFECEFCLSSLDVAVRRAPLPVFLEHLQRLLDRGARHLKFVDRTFNLDVGFSRAILEFLLERHRPGRLFHFEMIPDRLPEALREVIARFPPGALQFEVGVQSCNDEVCRRIRRRQDFARLEDNLRFLRAQTGVHVHADLIAGLPGESLESFAAGFDRLVALGPQEIQVGLLKRLRGAPIARHDADWGMTYNPNPPYEVLQNKLVDFGTMQRLRRFARYWDLVGNSGNFTETTPLLWRQAADRPPVASGRELTANSSERPHAVLSTAEGEGNPRAGEGALVELPPNARPGNPGAADPARHPSPFFAFLRWSDWLFGRVGRTDSLALHRLAELLFEFLTGELGQPADQVAGALARDYQRAGRADTPEFLRPWAMERRESPPPASAGRGPKRQARHLPRT